MPRVVSFIVLLAIILLIGSMFFQVMVQFIVPLFLAAVLVVIFKPLHLWVLKKLGHRTKLSAIATTILIVLIVLLPISAVMVRAVSEGAQFISEHKEFAAFLEEASQAKQPTNAVRVVTSQHSEPEETDSELDSEIENTEGEGSRNSDAPAGTEGNSLHLVVDRMIPSINEYLSKMYLPNLKQENVHAYVDEGLKKVATTMAVGGVQVLASTLMSLAIMVLTLYYFFSDGPNMIVALMKLSPLDDTYEQELLDKFADVSRSVVVAVLLSAIVQGLLAGIGYYFAGIGGVFLLTVITCFLAMVPFVGAAAVWVPVCLYLYFGVGSTTAAVVLAVYCATIVSMSDNVVKPMVLHGQSNLHPLLALLSVIGGIQTLGPVGIMVGPMLVAFLQALLTMLNKELQLLGQESKSNGPQVALATTATGVATIAENPQLPQPPAQKKKRRKKK